MSTIVSKMSPEEIQELEDRIVQLEAELGEIRRALHRHRERSAA